jgi:hypothetical protein
MASSPFKAGYNFQHLIRDYFLELGFLTQEEQWETRTDIVLSYPPFEIAVECKHYVDGVTAEHVTRFDQRLKEWQKMGRPCLGAIVATSFQPDAIKLCENKNIFYITQHAIETAIYRKREVNPLVQFYISKEIDDLIKSLASLMKNWLNFLFGDHISRDLFFLSRLEEKGYISDISYLSNETLLYSTTDRGKRLIIASLSIYNLIKEKPKLYLSSDQIAIFIQKSLSLVEKKVLTSNDLLVLSGMGLVEIGTDGVRLSSFGEDLISITYHG